MATVVIDVNVPKVANGQHDKANLDCIRACIQALKQARNQIILVDDAQRIFSLYRVHLSHSGQPGAGDAFFKWLWERQSTVQRCKQITITPTGDNPTDYAEYPTDPELDKFDPADRIYVAVARGSALNPDILNASDTDWWIFREAFERNGVSIRFLCEDLMRDKD